MCRSQRHDLVCRQYIYLIGLERSYACSREVGHLVGGQCRYACTGKCSHLIGREHRNINGLNGLHLRRGHRSNARCGDCPNLTGTENGNLISSKCGYLCCTERGHSGRCKTADYRADLCSS